MLFWSSSNELTGSIYFSGTFFTGTKQAGSLNVGMSHYPLDVYKLPSPLILAAPYIPLPYRKHNNTKGYLKPLQPKVQLVAHLVGSAME